jgi:hypothetical protein
LIINTDSFVSDTMLPSLLCGEIERSEIRRRVRACSGRSEGVRGIKKDLITLLIFVLVMLPKKDALKINCKKEGGKKL